MKTINLYRYNRPDGGVTVSTQMPDGEYIKLYRLIADEDMILTDGNTKTSCVDTSDISVWIEIEDTKTDEPIYKTSTLDAEIIEKARAYDELMKAKQ
jgi:hypothetical protein